MSDVRPNIIGLQKEFSFKVLVLFQEAPRTRSISSTRPSGNHPLEGLVGIKVNDSMIASRMWGEVYDSTKIMIPPGFQIVGWIYRSPPNGLRKAWFFCRGWPWRTYASDKDRELDQAVLTYQLVVDSAAASGRTFKTLVEEVKDSTTHQKARDAWTGLMKRGPTTCPTCGSQTSYQDASTQTKQDSIWPYGLPAIFAKPGSAVGASQPDSDLWTSQQLEDFMKSFGSSSQAAGQ